MDVLSMGQKHIAALIAHMLQNASEEDESSERVYRLGFGIEYYKVIEYKEQMWRLLRKDVDNDGYCIEAWSTIDQKQVIITRHNQVLASFALALDGRGWDESKVIRIVRSRALFFRVIEAF